MSDEEYYDTPIDIKEIDRVTNSISLTKFSFRDVMRYMEPWTYNRNINEDRVKELYESLCDTSSLQPPWTFHVIYDSANDDPNAIKRYMIIDGAHRAAAIRRYIELRDVNMDCERSIYSWTYDIRNAENAMATVELFKKINNHLKIDDNELPDLFIIELVETICRHDVLKRGIVTRDSSERAHKPNIHKKELRNALVLHRDTIQGLNIPSIVERIQAINHHISLKDASQLVTKQKDIYRVKKAHSNNFFLNMPSMPPSRWIPYIAKTDLSDL